MWGCLNPFGVTLVLDTSGCMYGGALYSPPAMPAEKTVAVSFRVSPQFKLLLQAAAARERRSQTNMLEALLFDYCEQHGIDLAREAKQIEPLAGGAK